MFKKETSGTIKEHIQHRAEQDHGFGLRVSQQFNTISNTMYELVQKKADPAGTEGQAAAKKLWDMIQDFTDGDINVLSDVLKFSSEQDSWPENIKKRQAAISNFMNSAISVYLENNNIDMHGMMEGNSDE